MGVCVHHRFGDENQDDWQEFSESTTVACGHVPWDIVSPYMISLDDEIETSLKRALPSNSGKQ